MLERQKFKGGFTWRHYFDEWWDRRPHEWKVRLFLWTGLSMVLGAVGFFLWVHRWMEREEILAEAKRIHQKRIEGADKVFSPNNTTATLPKFRDGTHMEIRSTD